MYLTQLVHRGRQARAATVALVCGDQRRTYGEFFDRVARLAGALRARGVAPLDRIAVLSHNSIECFEIAFAAWWVGAVVCPVNNRWSVPEIVFSLHDCTPGVLFVDTAHAALVPALREQVVGLRDVIAMGGDLAPGEPCLQALIDDHAPIEDGRFGGDHLAALLYTGGTTGRPKGVMVTHRNLVSASMCRLADADNRGDGVVLLATPVFHIAGFGRVLVHLLAGGTCVLMPQFRADEAIALIEREGVSDANLVPSMLQMVLDHAAFRPERLRSVRRLGYGAAPSARALIERTTALLPWVGFFQSYGMTESMAIGSVSTADDHSAQGWQSLRATSAGRACGAIELCVADEQGAPLPPGQVGEILLRGPTIFPGYWNRPQETQDALRDGWLHTGDAGRLDERGYLYVVDRLKDMIVSGGENVYSAEVETVLARHPAVGQCSVIGVPSERWGEAVHAVVVLRAGASADAATLQTHCREFLAGYKCPKTIEFVQALPLTSVGKVAKTVLRERHRSLM